MISGFTVPSHTRSAITCMSKPAGSERFSAGPNQLVGCCLEPAGCVPAHTGWQRLFSVIVCQPDHPVSLCVSQTIQCHMCASPHLLVQTIQCHMCASPHWLAQTIQCHCVPAHTGWYRPSSLVVCQPTTTNFYSSSLQSGDTNQSTNHISSHLRL